MNKQDADRLLQIAADLVRGIPYISSYVEDMPKTTPKSVLKAMELAEEWGRQRGIELRDMRDRACK